ncbi:hypothetical protein [Xylella fastidiosa]|uniref:hypothetical protein n=1 Tax=Xylella fastidiosa TaxID=2371 RepID=UPI0013E30F63|nr:hypothetical protein [Xylella fastidiosa]
MRMHVCSMRVGLLPTERHAGTKDDVLPPIQMGLRMDGKAVRVHGKPTVRHVPGTRWCLV